MSSVDDKRPFVVIGTSGSTDYLKDATDDRRFWPVRVEPSTGPLSQEDRAIVDRLVALHLEPIGADEEACDGIHDDGAPAMYLCTRCFPGLGGDLARIDEEDDCRDEPEEME